MAENLIGGRQRARSTQQSRSVDLRQNLFRIPDNISVALGLRWDFIGVEPVDLDASCVAFDEDGVFVDVVFFNRLKTDSDNLYMEHTGDNQTGEDETTAGEDDETIILHMNKIPANVHYLMVCVTSYTGADFTLVEKASCRLLNLATKAMVGEFQLGIVGRHSATLLCGFSRVPNDASVMGNSNLAANSAAAAAGGGAGGGMTWWDLREINFPCSGYTFCDVLPKMLDFLAVPEEKHAERLARIPDYSLQKEDDTAGVLSQIHMGLGWDGENDLDAALIFLNGKGDYVDHVYAKYGRLKSRDGAAIHSGDKLNGYEVIGDDEFVDLDLNKVAKDVEFIFFIALLYDGFAKNMGSVPHAYCRLTNKSSPVDKRTHELNRHILKNSGSNTCAIVSYAKRTSASHWEHFKLNEGTGGRDYVDVFPIVRSIAASHPDFSAWQVNRLKVQENFAIEVTIVEARNLSPLEPHQFACHVRIWVCDRKGKGRVKSSICHDRDNIQWGNGKEGESFNFAVNRMDVVRVLLYEHSIVGLIDLSVSEIAAQLFDEPNMLKMMSPTQPSLEPGADSTGDVETTEKPMTDNTSGNGDTQQPPAAAQSSSSPPQQQQQSRSSISQQQQAAPMGIQSSDRILDDWYPLKGRGISGEVRLQIRQISMDAVPEDTSSDGGNGGGGGWCSIM